MTGSSNATMVLDILRKAAATPYLVSKGRAETKKVARISLRNSIPIVVEVDRKIPNMWILPEHERGAFKLVGNTEFYPAGRGRHSHLAQVREFLDRGLLKVTLTSTDWREIEAAITCISTTPTT